MNRSDIKERPLEFNSPMNDHAPRILIVEDNRAMNRVVAVVLEQCGYEVTCEYDGESGWEATQQTKFDLIITDQQMPRLLGQALCERLRNTEEYKTVPILMLTAKGMELDLESLKKNLGINQIFAKPFSPVAIAQAVEQELAAV